MAHSKHRDYNIRFDITCDIKELLLSSLQSFNQNLDNLTELKAKVNRDIDSCMTEMTDQRDHLIKEINVQFHALCKELDQKHDDINNALLISKNLAEEAFSNIQELIIEIDNFDGPIKGIPEAKIDYTQLLADFRDQIMSADVKDQLKRVSFATGTDHVRLGKIVEKCESIFTVVKGCPINLNI